MRVRPAVVLAIAATVVATACGKPKREVDIALDRVLTSPPVAASPGFAAKVLVAPGEMYDPLSLVPHEGAVWVNDDGGEDGEHGGRIYSVDRNGAVSVLVDFNRLLPPTGFDVAPAGFGAFAGQILTLSQPRITRAGSRRNHLILRVDPRTKDPAAILCTLPNHGTLNDGIPGAGIEARFGPPDSPFANRFFALTLVNQTVYQATADGNCRAFATFDRRPWGFAFSADGKRMLVTVTQEEANGSAVRGGIVSVTPDGTVDDTFVFENAHRPFDVEVAPRDFGAYAGQIFFTDWETASMNPTTQKVSPVGTLRRIAPDGSVHLVASGFFHPTGIAFVDDTIWVADMKGDFLNIERQELPDGAIVRLDLTDGSAK